MQKRGLFLSFERRVADWSRDAVRRRGPRTTTTVAAIGLTFGVAGVWTIAASAIPATPPAAAATTATSAAGQTAMAHAFAVFKGIPLDDVGALRTGSLHIGYDPSTQTYWGTASFLPSTQAGPSVAVTFQDGGGIGIFQSGNGTAWTMTGVGGQPFPCAGEVPATVEAAWGLESSPYCAASNSAASPLVATSAGGGVASAEVSGSAASQSSGTSPIAQIATSQVGIGDTPVSTNFLLDCDPYTTMVGAGASSAGCGLDAHFGVQDENEFWCADFAKWVWEQAGVTANLGTLTPGASSFYTWGAQRGDQLLPDGNNPAVGDAVVFYPPGSLTASGLSYADHVAIVVGVNADGTVNLVNGDFGGSSNISVQLFNDVSMATWASFMWNTGEQWVYVSPGPGLVGGRGIPSGRPAALANSSSLMNVFYQMQDGAISNEYWTPATSWSLQTLPGAGAAANPAAVANSATWMNVWFTTTGKRVVNDFWNPRNGWLSQVLPGGNAVGDVAAVANSGSLMNVFYATPGGRIENDFWVAGIGWLNQTLPGGNAASAPTAVGNSSTRMNVWYTNTDGDVVNDYWTPSTGWVSQLLPGGYATGTPAGVANSAAWMNVWYINLDGQIYNDYWTPSTGWVNEALPSVEAMGAPSGVANSSTWMNVWYTTNDGQLNNIYWTAAGGWTVQPLPGSGLTGSPTGVVNGSGMYVFYVAANDRIGEDTWIPGTGWVDGLLPL
jgi:CHAP domain